MAAAHFSERTRSYQQEMFERSMEGNVIVMMDTGSGKTQIAMLRIQAELDRCALDKMVWFIAPSVELCIQQHAVLSAALPAYTIRLFTGQDNVDKWSEESIWNAALDCVRVVVSTPAILADALQHAFVKFSSIALLVFDEAHHCIKGSPANVIMQKFYHPLKQSGGLVPHILGLSASLIISSNLNSMAAIEANLDSIGVTPRLQRQDLMRHVFRPECRILRYALRHSSQGPCCASSGLEALRKLVLQHSDQHHQFTPTDHDVFTILRKLITKAVYLQSELGDCAADYFIHETILFLRSRSDITLQLQLDFKESVLRMLNTLFTEHAVLEACCHERFQFTRITEKVQCLIDYLLQGSDQVCGIVFVTQRVGANVLGKILNTHPKTKDILRCVTAVGMSNNVARKFTITDLHNIKAQREALSSFRQGRASIIVSTSVLEEGIDVQTCNVVACFDPPTNLRSFIQRRGRARHQQSRLALLLPNEADPSIVAKWLKLEAELTKICQKDREQAEIYRKKEEENESMDFVLKVELSGATLDQDSTLQHLRHFCQVLHSDDADPTSHADSRPIFTFSTDETKLFRASVMLPQSVPAHLRVFESKKGWRTERAAMKDAAFHAYAALHDAGLLNDNLLPLSREWNVDEGIFGSPPPARVELPTTNLWVESKGSDDWYRLDMRITAREDSKIEQEPLRVSLYTYGPMPAAQSLQLYWDASSVITVDFEKVTSGSRLDEQKERTLHKFTSSLYCVARSRHHQQVPVELAALFGPVESGQDPDQAWYNDKTMEFAAEQYFGISLLPTIVKVASRAAKPYLFESWIDDDQGRGVICKRLSRRRNFLVPIDQGRNTNGSRKVSGERHDRLERFAVEDCSISSIPVAWARVGLLMPAILQHVYDFTLVHGLISSTLPTLGLNPLSNHISTAINAPSATRQTNYQRYEFIGDCLLKFVLSVHLYSTNVNWPEEFLTRQRSFLGSNATLASAALIHNINRYIITESIDHRHWTLPSLSDIQTDRILSSKTLADVIESLIGAIWLEAGLSAAKKCIAFFIPSVELQPVTVKLSSSVIQPEVQLVMVKPSLSVPQRFANCNAVEALIGYEFSEPALLHQALSHPSYAQFAKTNSFQRLEYLGDAVLDMTVMEVFAQYTLSQGRMTQVKAALVNADILGFYCLNLSSYEQHRAISSGQGEATPEESIERHERSLADYIYFSGATIMIKHRDCTVRFREGRHKVQQELLSAASHPWTDLCGMNIHKMYSDVIESVIGAIFLDSGHNLGACSVFLRRIGLQQYVRRVIEEDVDVSPVKPADEGVPIVRHVSREAATTLGA